MRLRLLGGLELMSVAGASVSDATRQTRLMLACLALAGPKGLTRSELCALFWPDRPSTQARNSLRQGLAAIRKHLLVQGDDAVALTLHSDLEVVRLSAAPGAVDVHTFHDGATAEDRSPQIAAAQAWLGEPLAGLELPESVQQFLSSHRRSLTEQALKLAERLSMADATAREALDAAQILAQHLLMQVPSAEEAHRALMRVHLQRGSPNSALRQFERCKQALRDELQTEPDTETRRIIEAIHTPDLVGNTPEPRVELGKPAQIDHTPIRQGPHPSVAVMPFDNLGDESDEYFADGVVEEITAALSRIRDFFVIARQSAFTFKGRFVDVKEVGRELGVAYVVEGTVRRGGDRLRISVQLVDAGTRNQLWSDRFEGETGEIFDFQDRIAAQVAGALKPAIRQAEIEAARRKPPMSLKAYDLVMRAFPKLWGQNASAIGEAIPILQEAVRADPNYGRAHTLLAWCHALRVTYLWSAKPDDEIEVARRAVDKALGLIDDDPTALTAAGAVTGLCGDQEGASALIERALALDPNSAWAWTRWGWVAIYRGEPELAAQRFENAMKLSPLDPFAFNARMGKAASLARMGRFGDAAAIAKDEIKRHPDVTWAYRQLTSWAAIAGDLPTARSAARTLLAVQPDFTIRRYLKVPTFRDMTEYRDRMAQGLRDAGLPEG
ncbi:BTAD domain-containing putative transcriptional regulator [Leptospira interrogans]